MSKRVDTKSEKVVLEKDGLKVQGWEKTCPVCHKRYTTTSRSQKFCSDACCKKAQTRKRRQQKEYNATKEIQRLSARSHSVAVETMEQLARLGLVEKKCECGCTEGLQVHHRDLNYLNNSPSNLQWVCPKCHAEIHSDIKKDTDVVDRYPEELRCLLSITHKSLKSVG